MGKKVASNFLKATVFVIAGVIFLGFSAMFFINEDNNIEPVVNNPSSSSLVEPSSSSESSSEPESEPEPKPEPKLEPEPEPEPVPEVPEPAVSLSDMTIHPGEGTAVLIENLPAGHSAKVSAQTEATGVYPMGDKHIAFVPVSYFNKAGSYWVKAELIDEAGTVYRTVNMDLAVEDKEFDTQNLVVDQTVTDDTYSNNDANNEFNSKYLPLRTVSDSEKHWEGAFIMPCEGRISTTFGTVRYVNGKATSERHGGTDIAAPLGTTIVAPNGGRVLFADFLQLTGYTILIEHGFGLKTNYYHMDSIDVKAGDIVTQGQKIGEVGTTGFSTGPHLHYAMSINKVYIDTASTWENIQ